MPRLRFRRAAWMRGLLALALIAGGTHRAAALQFDVTTNADSGAGSLRQALLDAAVLAGNDTVVVQPALGTIVLSSELDWSGIVGPNSVTIDGNGVTVDFNGASRGFVDANGRGVSIREMMITGVGGTSDDNAAPVLSEGGTVSLNQVVVVDNHVTTTGGCVAGAVLSEGGDVSITDCTLSDNTADGSADGSGAVLSEGGRLDAVDSNFERNVVNAGGNVGGALESEGGDVTVDNCVVTCNRATGTLNSDAGGGLLSAGGSVTVTNSTFTGNRGSAPGNEVVSNSIASDGPAPVVTGTTISDDASTCIEAIESFFLPKKVVARVNAKSAAKSTVTATGIFDTGPAAPDFTSAATLDVGGLHFAIGGLVAAGKGFGFTGNGVAFTITPNPYGSSRAKFKLKFTGDLTGKVAQNGSLELHFANAITDGGGIVKLGKGVFGLGKVKGSLVQPDLFVVRARANLKGAGADALSLIVGLATGGVVPQSASDLSVGFGPNLTAAILGSEFQRKGSTDTFTGDRNGVTKVVVDYAREQISITGKALTLGTFAQGGNAVLISVDRGGDGRAVSVRMGRIGNTMKY